jgi:hypothetical protein
MRGQEKMPYSAAGAQGKNNLIARQLVNPVDLTVEQKRLGFLNYRSYGKSVNWLHGIDRSGLIIRIPHRRPSMILTSSWRQRGFDG